MGGRKATNLCLARDICLRCGEDRRNRLPIGLPQWMNSSSCTLQQRLDSGEVAVSFSEDGSKLRKTVRE